MSGSHMCVDLSFDLSRRFADIGLLPGCTLFDRVPGRKKFPVAHIFAMEYCLDICIIDVEYAVSIYLLVRLLMMIFLSSSS